jgi:hypothetical protein
MAPIEDLVEISLKWGFLMAPHQGSRGNFVEMGFLEGPLQGSHGNFVKIRFSEDLHFLVEIS